MKSVFGISLSTTTTFHRGQGSKLMKEFGKDLCKKEAQAYKKNQKRYPNYKAYCAGTLRITGVNLDRELDEVILISYLDEGKR